MSYNENRALGNLKSIHQAQEVFRETDRDQNGKNAYASFYIHLWQAVDDTGEVVPVNLISRNLAFAMGPSREINGYYFKDIHFRFDDQGREVLLDPEKEWALTAVPVQMGLTGRFIFLIDQKGGVYVKMAYEAPDIFPYDPISSGWVLVKDKIDMDAL
ncbi:MAG: DUF2950 family protein [Spirochaetales bacterium]|nr:DUF2950 family protein [Spirochaetales bacterium]